MGWGWVPAEREPFLCIYRAKKQGGTSFPQPAIRGGNEGREKLDFMVTGSVVSSVTTRPNES